MLSEEEKKEMLEDAKSIERRNDFGYAKQFNQGLTFDEYLEFLNNVQEIYGPFEISKKITKADLNKL